ncbi:flavin reductase family protein [Dactylosporangium cerinum]|uniref:Flavin reductase family protein n=1 Tax=Dactylosporangium cerinum TaxID=1434730 RepID=A0ABV9W7N2_9ACTN
MQERFKDAFRRYPTGVAVVTAAGPVGLTVSSVASVSVNPPALSFSVMATRSARALLAAPSFVVHLLGRRHAGLAQDFARSGGPRFTAEQGWETLPTGEPVLPIALAGLRAVPLHRLQVGDSTLVVAEVVDVLTGPDDDRLIYHAKQFVMSDGT